MPNWSPEAAQPNLAPVCGCNGSSYRQRASALAAGTDIATAGYSRRCLPLGARFVLGLVPGLGYRSNVYSANQSEESKMFSSFFKPVPRWDMAKAKAFIDQHPADAYSLIDVRQPDEYAEHHLPGAVSIPLSELGQRIDEIPPNKPTLVYCRGGGRAENGVMVLTEAGRKDVHNIGGILAWQGLVASGPPEAGMAYFDPARDVGDYVALAWSLEENARRFYLELAARYPAQQVMFEAMAEGEAHHCRALEALDGAPKGPIAGSDGQLMEGGIALDKALAWLRDRPLEDALEFCAAMEANAHDRYIRLGRSLGAPVQAVFVQLAEAEKVHLEQLMAAFQQALAG